MPVSTPGNPINYGIEGNVGATYRNTGDGIYGGVTWGLFFPMGALDRPFPVGPNAADAASRKSSASSWACGSRASAYFFLVVAALPSS